METVACKTCFLELKDSGLNIVILKLKGQALTLAGLASTLTDSNDPSFFLCRVFVGRHLSSLGPEWASLRSNFFPNAAFPTPFYDSCIVSVTLASFLLNVHLNGKHIAVSGNRTRVPYSQSRQYVFHSNGSVSSSLSLFVYSNNLTFVAKRRVSFRSY